MVNILVRDIFPQQFYSEKATGKKKTSWVILCQNLIIFDLLTSSAFQRESEDAPLFNFFLMPKKENKKKDTQVTETTQDLTYQ